MLNEAEKAFENNEKGYLSKLKRSWKFSFFQQPEKKYFNQG